MRACPLLTLLLSALAVSPVALAKSGSDATPGGRRTLTILHVNDGESILLDAGRNLEEFGGAARLATLLGRLEKEADAEPGPHGTIVLSAGDNFEPGPSLAARRSDGPFFDAVVLDRLGFDALGIGNHEFDFGPSLLADFVSQFDESTPFLSANLDVSREPALASLAASGRIDGSTIAQAEDLRIGIVGVTTPLTAALSSPGRVRVVRDVAARAQAEIDALEAQGVDAIVLISHMQGLSEDRRLLSQLRCVDAVVSGGGAEVLASPDDLLLPDDEDGIDGPYPLWSSDAEGRRVPIVTTAGYYRYVGRLVLELDSSGEVVGVDEERSRPIRVASTKHPDGVEPDATIEAEVTRPLRDYVKPLEQEVFATLHVPLDGRRATLRSSESNEANLLTDAMLWKASQVAASKGAPRPVGALLNGGSIRHDSRLLRGQRLTGLDLLHATPFDNELVVLPAVPPERLKAILENAVSRVEDGDGRFLHVAGLRFAWHQDGEARVTDGEPGARVRDVSTTSGEVLVKDGAVVSEQPVTLVVTDFLHRGGDEHPLEGLEGIRLGVTTQAALQEYLKEQLGGQVKGDAYPPGGEGRIVRLR